MQQMKDTVVSTMQSLAGKNHERPTGHLPTPEAPPIPTPPSTSIHHPPPVEPPLPHPQPQRRSRSHHHHLDKRPISIRRSPRRQRSTRRAHRSSRPRSSSRRRRSTSRHHSRATSITLRSASPRHRERHQRRRDDYELQEPTYPTTTLQQAKWGNYPQRSSHFPGTQSHSSHYDHHTTNTWKSWSQWKDYTTLSPLTPPTLLVGSTTPSHHPGIKLPILHQQDLSLHIPQTKTPLILNPVDRNNDQVLSNLVHPPSFLRDMLPLISIQDLDKTGLVL